MKRVIALTIAATAAIVPTVASAPLWMRHASISPDGRNIAFTYKGDIYTVPTKGGEAKRLTSQESYESSPIWSPDSRKIAFTSDRHGNADIFIMDAGGGTARRLTSHSAAETPEAFSPDGKEIYYSATIQAPASSAVYPAIRMTQLYAVDIDKGTSRQVLGTPAQALSFLPDGKRFVYQDVKGIENVWRKHHTSSTTSDIWLYDPSTGKHTNLTDRPGEDRNAVVSADGRSIIFLSERDGKSFNIYRAPIDTPQKAEALTSFKTHPVRFLSQASDGTLAFGFDGELYTLAPGSKTPAKVAVSITLDDAPQTERIAVSPSWVAPSPDGKQVAFASRGDIFVASDEHNSLKQVTSTPGAESAVSWHPEGREIVYTSKRDGRFNIYSAKIVNDDDPNFSNATLVDERPVVADDKTERTYPRFSPDGKQIAYVENRNCLVVRDVASGKTRRLTDGSTYRYRDGGFDFEWSPDGRWIVLEIDNNHHSPYTDIGLINVATGELTNLTRSGYTDRAPRFVMDGNAIAFLSERYGMRNHASWGSLDDVMIIFLNREALDRFNLSEEDLSLLKDAEKKSKKGSASKGEKSEKGDKADKTDKSDKDDSSDKADKGKKTKEITVELDGIDRRIRRLTPYSGDIADAWVDSDGENLYYLLGADDKYDLWKMNLRKKEPKVATRLDAESSALAPQPDGKTLWVAGKKIYKIDPKTDKSTPVKISGRQLIDHAAERSEMFEDVVVSEREMFYDKNLHGVDWTRLANDYRRFLPHINNNYDFAEMLSELLGELNVSHTGASFRGNEASAATDRTAYFGLLYDMAYDGKGLKVDEVIEGGPFDKASSKMSAGCVITAVNGEALDSSTDVTALTNNIIGKKTLVRFTTPSGEEVSETIIPVSGSAVSALLYDRWVRRRAEDVDRMSGGRLGYVHIPAMKDASFRNLYADVLGKYNDREGVVIDIRWNGGGRMHEDIEILFSGNKYFTQVIRGNEICDMPSRRYNKPSIMLIGEACYSNAHGTPWVYSHQGLGKLVGMPVPGTMTSVNWVRLQDNSMVFGIPVVGYRLPDGSYLENTQLDPDIKVANDPALVVKGEDAQLRAAVEELLRQIDSK